MIVTYEEVLKMKKEQKISCSIKKDLKVLPEIINPSEELVTFIQTNTNPQGLISVTNKRVIYVSVKNALLGRLAGVEEISIQLQNINSVQTKRHLVYSDLHITDGAQTYTFNKIISMESDRFVQVLRSQMDAPTDIKETSNSQTPPSKDGIEEIKKYKELFDLDIITKDEFEDKKRELLNL